MNKFIVVSILTKIIILIVLLGCTIAFIENSLFLEGIILLGITLWRSDKLTEVLKHE